MLRKCLQRDLENLHRDLFRLWSAVEEALRLSIRSLTENDPALGYAVIQNDDRIDGLENEIDQECLRLLALHQPLARDLRCVTEVMSITTDLERVGDLACSLADRAVALAKLPAMPMPSRLGEMAEHVRTMVCGSLDAFVRSDAQLARSVCRIEDEVNRLNAEICAELVDAMKQQPQLVEPALSLFSAVRVLERIADHATHIAEGVIHLVEGWVAHHHPEIVRSEIAPTVPVSTGIPGATV
jgi:phosphate transport system protein